MVPDPVADMIQRKLLEERVAKRVANDILGEEGQLLSPVSRALGDARCARPAPHFTAVCSPLLPPPLLMRSAFR